MPVFEGPACGETPDCVCIFYMDDFHVHFMVPPLGGERQSIRILNVESTYIGLRQEALNESQRCFDDKHHLANERD